MSQSMTVRRWVGTAVWSGRLLVPQDIHYSQDGWHCAGVCISVSRKGQPRPEASEEEELAWGRQRARLGTNSTLGGDREAGQGFNRQSDSNWHCCRLVNLLQGGEQTVPTFQDLHCSQTVTQQVGSEWKSHSRTEGVITSRGGSTLSVREGRTPGDTWQGFVS